MAHNPKIMQSALDIQATIADNYNYESNADEIADDISDMRPGYDRIVTGLDDNESEHSVTIFMTTTGEFLIARDVCFVRTR
jgi:hypothetical protein